MRIRLCGVSVHYPGRQPWQRRALVSPGDKMIARGLVFNELSAACLGEANAARVAQCDRQGANARVHSGELDTAYMRRLNRPPPKRRKRQRTQVHRHCLEPRPHSAYMQTASETTTAIIKGPFERLSSAAPHGGPITTRTFTSLAPAQVASTWPLLRTSGDVTLIGKPTWTRAVAMTSHQRCIKLQLITRGLALAVSTGAPDIS